MLAYIFYKHLFQRIAYLYHISVIDKVHGRLTVHVHSLLDGCINHMVQIFVGIIDVNAIGERACLYEIQLIIR